MGSKRRKVLSVLLVWCLFTYGWAGWNDNNLVLVDGHWKSVDIDSLSGYPNPIVGDAHKRNNSIIVVMIAALRETRLPDTLLSMFDNAAHPDRIRAIVVQQNENDDIDAVVAVCKSRGTPVIEEDGIIRNVNCKEFNQIRMLRLHVSEAAGPVYARARAAELVQDADDFCFQIDAHTIFRTEWDVRIQREWGLTRNEYGILTTYPTNYKHLYQNSNKHWEMPHLCGAKCHDGVVVNDQAKAAANLQRPLLAPLWAAGMSFSKCHAERDVPNDIELRQVFAGEEYARGVRLWTHGYDFYSVTRPIIGTYYGSEKGGKGGWHTKAEESRASRARMKTLVRFRKSDQSPEAIAALGKYDLGTRRTLQQYIKFSGLDPSTCENTPVNCIVKYVPWTHDSGDLAINSRLVGNQKYQEIARNVRDPEPETIQRIPEWVLLVPSVLLVFAVLCFCMSKFCFSFNMPQWERNRKNILKVKRMRQAKV